MPTAQEIISAQDAHDRAIANLRNAVALPADDPRGTEALQEKAVEAFTRTLVRLDEVRDAVRAAGPVRAPGAEEPFGEAEAEPAAKAA